MYQICPRSFKDSNGDGIGDLRGIISKLNYVKSLGVDVIWLNQIYPSPNEDNGYDISDYRGIMKEFGTMQDFDELMQATHAHSLKLVLDLVVNHSSDQHPWSSPRAARGTIRIATPITGGLLRGQARPSMELLRYQRQWLEVRRENQFVLSRDHSGSL